jgi:hypothetical protein
MNNSRRPPRRLRKKQFATLRDNGLLSACSLSFYLGWARRAYGDVLKTAP